MNRFKKGNGFGRTILPKQLTTVLPSPHFPWQRYPGDKETYFVPGTKLPINMDKPNEGILYPEEMGCAYFNWNGGYGQYNQYAAVSQQNQTAVADGREVLVMHGPNIINLDPTTGEPIDVESKSMEVSSDVTSMERPVGFRPSQNETMVTIPYDAGVVEETKKRDWTMFGIGVATGVGATILFGGFALWMEKRSKRKK